MRGTKNRFGYRLKLWRMLAEGIDHLVRDGLIVGELDDA